jgi:hypothetical protein
MLRTVSSVIFLNVLFCIVVHCQTETKFLLLEFPYYHKCIYLRGETNLSAVRRTESRNTSINLTRKTPHVLIVKGKGEIEYRGHRITSDSKELKFDGAALPTEASNFILTEDGNLKEGFIRTFDREPLHHKSE